MSTVYHQLSSGSLQQDWSNTGLITSSNIWTNVPSIQGYLGDTNAGSPTAVDPRTLTDAATGAVNVLANETNPNGLTNGGVAEFHIANPTVALNGSGTADAPSLVLYLNASGCEDVRVQFNARDLDGSADNAAQQIAVQYRIGETGNWTNMPGGYIADATQGGQAGLSTAIDVTLPSDANNQAQVQVRILTTNAAGNDEWVGIDDINVSSTPLESGEETVIGGIRILDQAESLQGSVEPPVANGALNVTRMGEWLSGNGEGGSESIAFDHTSDRAYVTNAAAERIDILDLSNPAGMAKVGQIDLTTLPGYGNVNSVAVRDGLVAVAVQNIDGGENGLVALYDGAGTLIKTIEVGVLPDQITFSPDGKLLLVANEAERFVDRSGVEPVIENAPGTISIIDVSGNPADATVRNTIGFSALDAHEAALDALGIKTYDGGVVEVETDNGDIDVTVPDSTVSEDIEPEYITVSPDGTKAYVTLQEVNAVAVIDLTDPSADKPVSLLPLGYVDFSLPGNEADFSDRDGPGGSPSISIGNAPIKSLLQPDAIASFEVGGVTYFVTANEGDSRILQDATWEDPAINEARADDVDPAAGDDYARVNVDTVWSEGSDLYAFGGRGFSVFQQNADGTIVKVDETGGDFEQIIASLANAGEIFNGENGEGFDSRSDNKGAEPEGIVVGEVNGTPYAFIALERVGGVMVWDVSTPSDVKFVQYIPATSNDYGPEIIKFVSAEESPTGRAMLITANEISGSVTTYDIEDPSVKTIMQIQGTGHVSEMDGDTVTTTGVVTAVDTNGSRGFWIQDPNGDGNAATSDAIFVFRPSGALPTVGQLVSVTGTVDEYTPNGAAPGSFSTTEIIATAADAITVLGTGPAIEAFVIGGEGGLLPPSSSLADAAAFYESMEGMLVTVKEAVVVGATNDFGEIYAVVDNDANRENGVNGSELNDRGALPIEGGASDFGNTNVGGGDFNPERIQIDDDNGVFNAPTPSVSNGAELSDVTGIIRYDFGNYEVVATQAYTVDKQSDLVKETTTLVGDVNRLTVASYNAENLDPNDGAARFNTIAQEIVTNLKTPDIISLQEVQDNDGPGNANGSTVTSASQTLQMLVNAINAAAPDGVEYAYIDNPFIGDDTNGGEGGGNIRTAFIYRVDRVDFVDGSLKTIAADGTPITDPAGNADQQTNPDNPFYDSRPPLIATFEFNGEEVTIVNNHFTSKGGSGALYGSDESPLNGGEVQRAAQAQAVNNFVDSLLANDPDAKIVVAGDLNDFEFEEPMSVVNGTGSISNYDVPGDDPIAATANYTAGGEQVLHDLLETLPADERYDYSFEGNAQSLDHVLVSNGLKNGAEFDVVRINSEFGDQTSDHDPLIASFDIPAEPEEPQNFTLQLLHWSDAEAGLLAGDTAPMMAGLIDAFDDDYANTLILSSGDSFIPGPFLSAGSDPALNAVIGSTGPARPDIAIHNAMGVEVAAIGNHEWDLGSNVFGDAIKPSGAWSGANYAYVSANLDFSQDSAIRTIADQSLGGTAGNNYAGQEASSVKGKVAPWVTVTEGGEKIGILGATTQILERISSPNGTEVNGFPKNGQPGDGTTEVDDMQLLADQLQPIIDQMIASGINKIILQSHLQNIDNEKLLATKLHGVDIIIAGGSNTRLGDADDEAEAFPGHDAEFEDTYPLVTQGTDGKSTLIVNTDGEYTYLGRLVVEFDQNGDIVLDSLTENMSVNGAYASTAENVAEAWGVDVEDLEETAFAEGTKGDAVRDITEAVDAVIAAKDGNVFGYTDVYLEGERSFVRNQETNFGNLSADANTHAARGAVGEEPFIVSLKNGGGIRAQIGSIDHDGNKVPPIANPDANKPAGAVSELDVENALRFDNKLMMFDTTPEGLLALLNWGAGLSANNGGFPQIGGVRFSFDPDLPGNSGSTPGSRVRDVALIDENGNFLRLIVDDGVVVDDAPETISVVTLNFTANGGDGYPAKLVGENFRYLLQDGSLSAAIDESLDFTAPANVPANAMGEQQAFEEYMEEFHGTPETAYDVADTPIELDERIQNLNFREDTVAEGAPITGDNGDNTLDGTANADIIDGKGGEDRIDGLAGDDRLFGDAGDDLIEGGEGNDYIDGGADDDVIFGDAGNDTLIGGLGNDVIKGNAGDDTFVVTSLADGRDSYDGGAGIDTLDLSALSQSITLTLKDGATTFATDTIENIENVIGGSADDKLTGNALDNVLSGNAGDDTLKGGVGNDTLNGGEGADDLDGGAGNDTLSGGAGNDVLKGGAGDDVIKGGAGNDTLTGGAGLDRFVFDSVSDGIDTITDFKLSGASEDRIVLSASMFEGFTGDDAFDLIGSGFLRAVVNGNTTEMQIDVDGGGDDFTTLAVLSGKLTNGLLADHVIVQQDPVA